MKRQRSAELTNHGGGHVGRVDRHPVQDAGPSTSEPREAGVPKARDWRGAAVMSQLARIIHKREVRPGEVSGETRGPYDAGDVGIGELELSDRGVRQRLKVEIRLRLRCVDALARDESIGSFSEPGRNLVRVSDMFGHGAGEGNAFTVGRLEPAEQRHAEPSEDAQVQLAAA